MENDLFLYRKKKSSSISQIYTNSQNIGILEILSFLGKRTKILIKKAVMASPEEYLVKESDFATLKTVSELQGFLTKLFPNPDDFFFFYLDFSLVELDITISNHEDRDIIFEINEKQETIEFMLSVFNKILLYDKKESLNLWEKLQNLPNYYIEILSKSVDDLNIYNTFKNYRDGKVIKKDK